MPKVSVCIPTYNRPHYLTYAVNSVLQQTYSDFELIICDDGSTDNTPEIVSQFNDSRLRYLRHPQNIGRSKNMRSGFENSQGIYFIKFDDDDGLTPEFLAKTVPILEQNRDVDFVCTNHWVIAPNNQRIESATKENCARWGKDKLQEGVISDLLVQTFQYQSLQVGSTLFRRCCLEEVDYMRPEADGCEDFDLLVRLAMAGKIGYFLPELLMEYRFHGQQISSGQSLHFLRAKVFCLESYHFNNLELEKTRLIKLAGAKRDLGLRLVEQGQSKEGRKLLEESNHFLGISPRSFMGIILSYLPLNLRQYALEIFRKIKSKDYAQKVRNIGETS
jgi:glycosyltransferase involved in cell wall biosynthesis